LISVVVVNWNRQQLLRACLRSLARQTGVAFEIIVVDNGSSDGSADMAEREFDAKVIRNAENRGFCAANNQGIQAASGEFIALLNNDAEAEPGWLEALWRACASAPDVGMAASKILVWQGPESNAPQIGIPRVIDKAGHLIFPDGQNRGRGSGMPDCGQFDREEEVLWPDGSAALYRRAMLDQIGGFDEDFFAYGDDAELGLRARIAGWRCIYTPKAVVHHHRSATLGKDSMRRLELIERNRLLLAVKLFPLSLLCWNSFYFSLRLVAGFILAQREAGDTVHFPGFAGKWKIFRALWRGHLEALVLVPRMWRKRAAIRAISRLSPRQVRRLIFTHRLPLREVA